MKKILLLLAVVFSFNVNAQEVTEITTTGVATTIHTSSQDSCYVYSMLKFRGTYKKYDIYLNYGKKEEKISTSVNTYPGEREIAALNQLSIMGWDLVHFYARQFTQDFTCLDYAILRKKIPTSEMSLYYSNEQ